MPVTGLVGAAQTRFSQLLKAGVAWRTALALADRVTDDDIAGLGGGGGGVAGVSSVNTRTGAVTLTKSDVGLPNVDNTSDVLKPVSNATSAAISAAIANLVNSAPGTMDTLGEIAALLSSDESTASALATTVAGKMAKAANGSDIVDIAAFRTALGLGSAALSAAGAFDASGAASAAQTAAIAAAASSAAGLYLPILTTPRGLWAATTAYARGDIVIAPTGDIVTPKVAFTSGASYSAANWAILVPAAGFPGRELAAAALATTVQISTIGVIGGLTDTTKDVNTAALDVSPVIGARPIMVEAYVQAFFGTTGGYGVRLVDKTANLVLAQADVAAATAFQIQEPAVLRWIGAPAAGSRTYGIRVNGTAGTNNMILDGADNLCSTFIRVVER